MADKRPRRDRRKSRGMRTRPPRSPANVLIIAIVGVLAVTAAASLLLGDGLDDGTPHGRLLDALQLVGDAQEAHYREHGRFTDWGERLDMDLPTDLRVTMIHGDADSWKAVAADPEVGLSCVQGGRSTGTGGKRETPYCYTEDR